MSAWRFPAARRSLRVKRLVERVAEPDPGEALAALEREVIALSGAWGAIAGTYEDQVRWVLFIASKVAYVGHPERALAWTMRVEPGALGPPVAAMHAHLEAGLRISTRDRAGARLAIARVPRPAITPWERALLAQECLLEALDGDAAAAVERAARALETPTDKAIRMTWLVARAHGLARVGAVGEARETLLAVRRSGGEWLLRRVVAHDGPASRLAEAALLERGAYR